MKKQTILASALLAMSMNSNAASFSNLGNGGELRANLGGSESITTEQTCGGKKSEGKCGGKKSDHKCGAKDSTKMKDHKCGEGKCGGKK